MERRLSAIVAVDVVGYSAMMAKDEKRTLAAIKGLSSDLVEPKIAQYRGKLIKEIGDGWLIEFASVIDAVTFAVEIQSAINDGHYNKAIDPEILLRIGVNIGDVVVERNDIYGDGVNIAARLEGHAQPGGICIHGDVRNQLLGKIDLNFVDGGEVQLKNIPRPVRVYSILLDDKAAQLVTPVQKQFSRPLSRVWLACIAALVLCLSGIGLLWWQPWAASVATVATKPQKQLPDKPSITVLGFKNLSGDPQQNYFSEAVTERISAGLSKFSGLFVLSHDTARFYRDQALTERERLASNLA